MKNAMKRLAETVRAQLNLMISRAVVRAVRDSGALQRLQVEVLEGELLDGVEHFLPYGLNAVPDDGAEAVVFFVGGSRNHGIALVTDRRYRPKDWNPAEAGLYSKFANFIRLKDDGSIEIVSPVKITLTAPEVAASEKITAGANIESQADVKDATDTLDQLRQWAGTHTHAGSPSAPVGPVTPTGAPTAGP